MKGAYGLSKETLDTLQSVFVQHDEISKAILHGSRAKGNYRNGSDIDITLIGKDLIWDKMVGIENDLDNLMLPYKLDISCYEQLENSELVDHINRVGKVLYQR